MEKSKNTKPVTDLEAVKIIKLMGNPSGYWIKRAGQTLEKWATWRVAGGFYTGGSGLTITGKMIHGMPGTNCPTCGAKGRVPGAKYDLPDPFVTCPTCAGQGRVPMVPENISTRRTDCPNCYDKQAERSLGEVKGVTCITCRGSGVKITHSFKANPALIRLPKKSGSRAIQRSIICERLDMVIAGFKINIRLFDLYRITVEEYTTDGTQLEKAGRMGGLSYRTYKRKLTEVKSRVAVSLWGGA